MDTETNQAGLDAPPGGPAVKRPRSATERVLVWCGIAGLLALVAIEAHGRIGYARTLAVIDGAFNDLGPDEGVPLPDVEGAIAGFPTVSVRDETITEVRTYRWWSLLHDYRIHVRVEKPGKHEETRPEVIGYATGTNTLSRQAKIPHDPAPVPKDGPVGAGVSSGGGNRDTETERNKSEAEGPAEPAAARNDRD